jgi:peptidyl-prolyl isomerase D
VVFGEVLNGKSIVRRIENLPTQPDDKPTKEVKIVDCGELKGEEALNASKPKVDPTGDPYEDFPEDQDENLGAAETLKIVSAMKEYGNKAFKAGNLNLGLDKYQKGLRYAQTQVGGDDVEMEQSLQGLRFILQNNSALVQLKLKSFAEARESASRALGIDGVFAADKAKAYYRRALASSGLKDDDEAKADLEKAAKLVPADPAITKELEAVKKRHTDQLKKEKAMYQKFFD